MGTRPRLGASASPDPEEHSPMAWRMGEGQRLESPPTPHRPLAHLFLHPFLVERCHLTHCTTLGTPLSRFCSCNLTLSPWGTESCIVGTHNRMAPHPCIRLGTRPAHMCSPQLRVVKGLWGYEQVNWPFTPPPGLWLHLTPPYP